MANNSLDVIFGAGSGIGQALIERWCRAGERRVLAVSRSSATVAHSESRPEVEHLACDYSDTALAALAERLADAQADVVRLVICNGVLQGEDYRPERALSQLDLAAMRQVFEINTFLPMRILAALTPALKQSVGTRVAVLSARVKDGPVLRAPIAAGQPRTSRLPLDPARDFYAEGAASPVRIPGDADPAREPFIMYGIPDVDYIELVFDTNDVVITF